ncbi:MAG: hypothetical protein AAGA30_17550 [Planctomycetota bacterium]
MFSYAVLGLAVIASSSVVTAQKFKTADPVVDVSEDSRQLDDFLTKLALDAMPVNYVEDKDWGMQVERWDGVKIRIEDGKLKTKRRKKMVNHGTWDRYEVSLVDPEKNFAVQLNNFQEMENEKVAFDVLVSAKIALESRQSKWIKGVQLYSISADGSASVRLKLSVSLGSKMDVGKFPPDLIFDPSITNAEIELAEFRIDRVSKAGGELAQQVTRVVRKKITQKIEEKENKLVQKLNSRIDKNRDRFRLSVHDAMKSKWAAAGKKLVEKAGSESPNKQEVVPDK